MKKTRTIGSIIAAVLVTMTTLLAIGPTAQANCASSALGTATACAGASGGTGGNFDCDGGHSSTLPGTYGLLKCTFAGGGVNNSCQEPTGYYCSTHADAVVWEACAVATATTTNLIEEIEAVSEPACVQGSPVDAILCLVNQGENCLEPKP